MINFSFRCSIFKVLNSLFSFSFERWNQLVYYITSFWVCQVFFQNIFYFVFSLGFALSDATFILYHTQLSLSSAFWNFLLKHFVHTFLFTLRSFSLSFRSVWISFSLFQDSLNIISYFVCFVKRFFKKLFGFLSWVLRDSLEAFRFA